MTVYHETDIVLSSLSHVLVKDLPAYASDRRGAGLIPGLGRAPGERNGTTLQFYCLESPMDGGAWWAIVRRVAKSWR